MYKTTKSKCVKPAVSSGAFAKFNRQCYFMSAKALRSDICQGEINCITKMELVVRKS
jgi:hypothetical protein